MDIESKDYSKQITNSHVYIRPLIGYNYRFYSSTCYNTHIDKEYNLYIVYNNFNVANIFKTKHEENKKELQENPYYRHTFSNDIFDIFAFSIDKSSYFDYDKFVDSRFTQFTDTYKGQLRKFYNADSEMLDIINNVISPSKNKIREIANRYGVDEKDILEVKSKVNLEIELYNKEDYYPEGCIYEYYSKLLNKTN